MRDVVLDILRRQQSLGFPAFASSEASAEIPVSDRLITEIVTATLPAGGPVRDIDIRAEAGNQLQVRVRLGESRFLPSITVGVAISEQPNLPDRPILGLRLVGMSALLMRTGALSKLAAMAPPGVSIKDDRIYLDLRQLLLQHGVDVIRYLAAVIVTTRNGAVVLSLRANVPPPATADARQREGPST